MSKSTNEWLRILPKVHQFAAIAAVCAFYDFTVKGSWEADWEHKITSTTKLHLWQTNFFTERQRALYRDDILEESAKVQKPLLEEIEAYEQRRAQK